MTDQTKKWEDALKEKIEYKMQLEGALNQTNIDIYRLQGGIQFSKESNEPVTGNIEMTEEEDPQP